MSTEQQIKPFTLEDVRKQEQAPFKNMPLEEALQRLNDMGYTPDTWDSVLSSGYTSHQVRILIRRAKGEEFL